MEGLLALRGLVEPEEGILPRCEELFNRPSPNVAIIPENVWTAFKIAVTFACKVVFSGMLLVRECQGRDGQFLKKMISMLFIFLLGEILDWFLMAKNEGFLPYEMWMGWISTLLPIAYQEKISFNFSKVALNDWIMKSYLNEINCGNWTEQSAIWSVIIHVISKWKKYSPNMLFSD